MNEVNNFASVNFQHCAKLHSSLDLGMIATFKIDQTMEQIKEAIGKWVRVTLNLSVYFTIAGHIAADISLLATFMF